jgi:hypothetical protein
MKFKPLAAAGAVTLAFLAAACGASSKPGANARPSSAVAGPNSPQSGAKPNTTAPLNPNAAEVNPAGDIPDDQVFVPYSPPSGGYSVSVPEGWSRTESGGIVTFTDKLNSIRMETVDSSSEPTVESARTNELPAIQSAAKNYEAGKVTSVTRKSGPAILITYRADAAPDPVTGKVVNDDVERYEFYRAGKLVVLTLSGPKGADNVDPWKIVTDSFTWK